MVYLSVMKNGILIIFTIGCFLSSPLSFSQETDDISLPSSIYHGNMDKSLITKEYGFFYSPVFFVSIHDSIYSAINLNIDSQILKMKPTFEELRDRYKKAALNKYFFKGYNMWDMRLQKESWEQINQEKQP